MFDTWKAVLRAPPAVSDAGEVIGSSREGRPIRAFRFGRGPLRISLLGGCHADEPVGPRLLRHLAAYLASLDASDALLAHHEWWILPHINPDGAERNRSWQPDDAPEYDLIDYLTGAVRELPGDDIEFGFPAGPDDGGARPENQAAAAWWRQAGGPFALHVSLHGMAFAGGPWFLIEPAWQDRCASLLRRCADGTAALGYRLHDVERHGEKGFFRIARGFCTRPDSRCMAQHFRDAGDEATARLFRPSSMECVRSLGGDTLTLVSEMPLFITPGAGEEIGPPDRKALEWRKKIDAWRAQLLKGRQAGRVRACSASGCLAPMPARDQMALQWTLIAAGIEQVEEALAGP